MKTPPANQAPITDTPPPPAEPAPASAPEHPSEGGSYIRRPDGSLVKQEG